ncbi:hypothetical protein [Paenisporosarcina sp. TG-14]|uniref:hypothetical protein n=1 Tax=Paenisporosarcina sp. TG-14 TaxID=1231057 RepID=UPI0003000007|nr:hypothetical protein [Paenisporosarcina sp. TG-14]
METVISKEDPVADTRINMTAFLLACIMLPSSFMPEVTVVKWLIINTSVLIIVLGVLYVTWQKNKFNTVRYYSLQVYILLMSIVFYAIVPLFKLLSDSIYFWLIALATIIFTIMAHVLNKRTTLSFVNRNHKNLVKIASVYVGILIFAGVVLSGMMQTKEAPENTGVSILFYLVGLFFIVLAPMFLLRKSEVDKLTKM